MKMLTSNILILVTIYGNIITEGRVIDINMVSDIVDQLEIVSELLESYLKHDLSVGKPQICLHNPLCDNETIQVCYARLLHFYNNHLMYTIIDIFNKIILKFLKEYNVLVMALLSKYPQMDPTESDKIIDDIDLNNSKAYCVIGFLSIINVELDDKLQDFVFFANLKHIYEKKSEHSNIQEIIETHFDSRADDLRKLVPIIHSDIKELTSEKISSKFIELKNTINTFSKPFCKTGLPWIQPDSWLWKNLESFQTVFKSFAENYNLLKWQDSQMEFKAVTITGGVKHNYNYDILPSVNLEIDSEKDPIQIFEMDGMDTSLQNPKLQDSLSTLFQREYDTATFSKIEDFYLTVNKSMDAYVINVLCYRVLEILVYALESFEPHCKSMVDPLDYAEATKNIIIKFLYLENELELFQATWELYTSSKPMTLEKYTTPDVNRMLDFARFVYLRGITQNTVSPLNVGKIKTFLKDVRFRRVSGTNRPTISDPNQWYDPSKELTEITLYLLKLVELKNPNGIQF